MHVQNRTGLGLSLSTVPTKIYHFGIRIQLLNGTWTYAMGVVINGLNRLIDSDGYYHLY